MMRRSRRVPKSLFRFGAAAIRVRPRAWATLPTSRTVRKLERNLTLFSIVSISIGAMLGGEIFVLPAVAAQMTGPSLWLAYLVAALLVLPAALSKSELATAMPDSGGAYLYIERAMGPMAGTIAGLGLWLSLLLKSTFALAILGSYLALLVDVPTVSVGLALLAFVTTLNLFGVRKVGTVQTVIVVGCVAVLFFVLFLGLRFIPERPDDGPWMSHGFTGFAASVGLVFISYAGVTKIAAIAEEVRDAERTIPRGILISLALVAALYTGIALVLARAFAPSELAGDETPLASLAKLAMGDIGPPLIASTAVFALLGMTNAGLLASSRFPFAMARGKLAPEFLAHVSKRFITPIPAILLSGLTMATILLTLDVVRIAKLASAFMIAAFMAVNASVIVFRESKAKWYTPAFRAPLYPYLQVFGILTGGWILVSLGTVPLLGVGIGVLAGTVLYVGYGRRRVSRLGVLRQMASRRDLLMENRVRTETGSHTSTAQAQTTVALFGSEPSAEALVHLGMTLSGETRLNVLHLEEVPEQIDLSSIAGQPDDRLASLERRLVHLGDERGVKTNFDVVYTRDVRETLYDHADHQHSRWVVMAWRDQSMRGFIVRNPMQWLMTHLPCNLGLFKDAGIRTYRKILAHAEPGPHDALVATTADSLARLFRAEVTFVRSLPSHATEDEVAEVEAYHRQLGRLCSQPTHSEILRSDDTISALVHATARFDLTITGTTTGRPLRSMFFPSPEEVLTENAHCAVLQLRAPRAETHAVVVPSGADGNGGDAIRPVATAVGLAVVKKEQLFTELGMLFDRASPRLVSQDVEDYLWARERTQNTAVGHGVAIPHATIPGTLHTKLVVAVLAAPIPYDEDGTLVDVCLCLIGPPTEREAHLRLLARLAQLILETDVLAKLRGARTETEVIAALTEASIEPRR